MVNIADADVLREYMVEKELMKPGDNIQISYCKGGVSGTVVYVEREGQNPIIVKQALEQLKTKERWLCDPNRMGIEYECNRIYHELMPDYAPEVYFYDEQNYIYAREAIPESCSMWKTDLMSGLLDFKVADQAIDTLVTVHNRTYRNSAIEEKFADKTVFYILRIEPYIEFVVKKYPQYAEAAGNIIRTLMSSNLSLVHGDFSPKNIMVLKDRRISILDYEVAHFGHPAFDLAFFANHFLLKAVNFPDISDAYFAMLKKILNRYFQQMNFMDCEEMETCTVEILKFLLLARVDGKSPVEYLTEKTKEQQLIRESVAEAFEEKIKTFDDMIAILKKKNCGIGETRYGNLYN